MEKRRVVMKPKLNDLDYKPVIQIYYRAYAKILKISNFYLFYLYLSMRKFQPISHTV